MKSFDYIYRVRYADTDRMGISYYANYLVWFEAARTEYFRQLGMPYTECEKKGFYLPVIESGVRYLRSSTYDDLLIVRTSVYFMRNSSMGFQYQVFNQTTGELLTTGTTVHTFVDRQMKPVRIPQEIRDAVTVSALFS